MAEEYLHYADNPLTAATLTRNTSRTRSQRRKPTSRPSLLSLITERTRTNAAHSFHDYFLSLGNEMPLRTPSLSNSRLITHRGIDNEEDKEANDKAWQEEFGDERQTSHKGGSILRFSFLQSIFKGEKSLEKRDQLELFHKTQRLPDYRRAEDAVKRGWGRWIELEFGIKPEQAKNKIKIRQFLLLHQLRGESNLAVRRQWLRSHAPTCFWSAERCDDGFFRLLGHALTDSPRKQQNLNDFTQVLLHNWLASFWWLMPIKAVAVEFARLQGHADDSAMLKKYNQRLWQIQTRATGGGGYFSQGWRGVFYSSKPELIACLEANGTPVFTPAGRRCLT